MRYSFYVSSSAILLLAQSDEKQEDTWLVLYIFSPDTLHHWLGLSLHSHFYLEVYSHPSLQVVTPFVVISYFTTVRTCSRSVTAFVMWWILRCSLHRSPLTASPQRVCSAAIFCNTCPCVGFETDNGGCLSLRFQLGWDKVIWSCCVIWKWEVTFHLSDV